MTRAAGRLRLYTSLKIVLAIPLHFGGAAMRAEQSQSIAMLFALSGGVVNDPELGFGGERIGDAGGCSKGRDSEGQGQPLQQLVPGSPQLGKLAL
jgi:hypothetical protein